MAEFTNRLNLQKPAGGSSGTIPGDDPADVDVLNANMDKLDAAIGLSFVTSTTRPSTPYDGQMIKEIDTQRFLSYRQSVSNWELVDTPVSGSAALRDLVYGVPSTAAERVSLANKAPLWLNTATGLLEQYFCATADSATAGYNALYAAATAGWKTREPLFRGDHPRFPFAMQAGNTAPRVVNGGNVSTDAVTFVAGRFTQAPLVIVSGYGNVDADSAVRISYVVTNVTTSGFNLRHINPDGAANKIAAAAWWAIQMLPGAASG